MDGITRYQLHDNGVHVQCLPGTRDTDDDCRLAGRVERFHSHDHDGPLVCGCEDD